MSDEINLRHALSGLGFKQISIVEQSFQKWDICVDGKIGSVGVGFSLIGHPYFHIRIGEREYNIMVY